MEKLITISIFLTEFFTLLVLGLVALAVFSVIYDHIKKGIIIEKKGQDDEQDKT